MGLTLSLANWRDWVQKQTNLKTEVELGIRHQHNTRHCVSPPGCPTREAIYSKVDETMKRRTRRVLADMPRDTDYPYPIRILAGF